MFEKAIEIAPNYALAYWGLGNAYEFHYVRTNNKKDYNLMVENYRKAYEIDSNNSQINFDIGSFMKSIGLYYQAIKFYSRTIYSDPLNIIAHNLRAICSVTAGEFERSAIYFKKALDEEKEIKHWT